MKVVKQISTEDLKAIFTSALKEFDNKANYARDHIDAKTWTGITDLCDYVVNKIEKLEEEC